MNLRPQDNTQGNVQLQHEILAEEELRNIHEVVLQHVVLQLNDHLQHTKHEHESLLQSFYCRCAGWRSVLCWCLSKHISSLNPTVPQLIEIGLRLVCRSMICTTAYVTDLIRPVTGTTQSQRNSMALSCVVYCILEVPATRDVVAGCMSISNLVNIQSSQWCRMLHKPCYHMTTCLPLALPLRR